MNLFEQLSAAAAAAKALKQPEARFLHATTTASFPLTTPTTCTPSHPLPAAAFMARRRSVTYPLIPLTQG